MQKDPSARCRDPGHMIEFVDSRLTQRGCCYREAWRDHDRCVWHAETGDGPDRLIEGLDAVRETGENRRRNQGGGGIYLAELLDGARLSGVELNDVSSFERCSLRTADLSRASLPNSDFSGAFLSKADFSEADVSRADFSRAELWKTNFSGADLSGAGFSGTLLKRVDLSEANLRETDFLGANISGTNLSSVDLSKTDIPESALETANLTGTHLGEIPDNDAAERFFEIVENPANNLPHGPVGFGEIIGLDVRFLESQSAFVIFVSDDPDDELFTRAEIRTPFPYGPAEGKLDAVVEFMILNINPNAGVRYRDIVTEFGQPDGSMSPPVSDPPTPERTYPVYVYDRPWGELAVGVRDGSVVSVTIDQSIESAPFRKNSVD